MANYPAIQSGRPGIAEMSCIAGVWGNVKKLVKTALPGRRIVAIDGCPLACTKACLANHSLQADIALDLSRLRVPKRQPEDFDIAQANIILEDLKSLIHGTSDTH